MSKEPDFDDYRITIDNHFSSFFIREIADEYAKLDSRETGEGKGYELTIYFDLEDEDSLELRDMLRRVKKYHETKCPECKEKDKPEPIVHYELQLEAVLRDLKEGGD